MSVIIDRKYLGMISHKLSLFKQKNTDLYNFRCPFCNDSKKNKLKARGYVYRKNNDYFMRCHNCGKSTTFSNFLLEIDASQHKQYVLERFVSGETGHHNYKKPKVNQPTPTALSIFGATPKKTYRDVSLANINELPKDHFARNYMENRKIPQSAWNEIFFTPKFKDFLDKEFPNHGKDNVPNDERIVMFFTDEKGVVTHIAGRALSTETKIRYVTVKILDTRKVFGLHRLNKNETIYIVEGQFDSLFVPNCVASGDAHLLGVATYLMCDDVVIIYDNDRRNKDIINRIEETIDLGYSVCLFPDNIVGKDINEMVLNGNTPEEVLYLINKNTYKNLTAKMRFNTWKRC